MAGRQEREGLLAALARLDRTKVFLGALAVALLGLFLPGAVGAALLFAVVAALAALLSLTWHVATPGHRAFRLAVLACLGAIATLKLANVA